MTYTCRCHGACGCSPIVTTQPTGASAPSGLDEVITIAGIPRKKRFGLAPNNNSAAIWSLLQWPTEDEESVQKRQLQELKDADIQHIRDKVRAQIMAVEQERQRHKQQTRTKNAKQLAIQKRVGIVPQHATLDDDESDDDDISYPTNEEKDKKENKGEENKNEKKENKEQGSSNDMEQKYIDPIVTALSRQQRIKSHNTKIHTDEKFYAETNAKQDERRLKMAYFRQKFDEERKAQLARDHSIAPRDLPDSTISFEQSKPAFHPYGNANVHPVSGGVMYGNYMASHNTNALSPRKTAPIHTVFESVREKVEQKKKQTKRALRRHAELQRQQLLTSQQTQHENHSRQQQQIIRQQAYIQQLHNQMDHKHHPPANTSTDDGYFVQLTPRVKPSTGIKRPASAGSNRAILTR